MGVHFLKRLRDAIAALQASAKDSPRELPWRVSGIRILDLLAVLRFSGAGKIGQLNVEAPVAWLLARIEPMESPLDPLLAEVFERFWFGARPRFIIIPEFIAAARAYFV